MNNEDYVSYELALALKKCGFDEPCDHYYTNGYAKHMKWSTISLWVKKHNPIITDELIASDILYFMDRV